MGPVDLQYVGEKKIRQLNKSENGLGSKVLGWMAKDLQRWAVRLGVVDGNGRVLSATSIGPEKSHPQSHDAAMMTKRDCRTVFVQIAQQTRLRSIFINNKIPRLTDELIPQVLKKSSFAHTEWEDCPSWWNGDGDDGGRSCNHDFELLEGILDYGYGGFDSLLAHNYSFCRLLAAGGSDDKALTRAIVQVRINHLTRELHAINETEDMMKLVEKSKRKGDASEKSSDGKAKKAKTGSIQSGIQAFFKKKKEGRQEGSPSQKRKTPPTSPENSDVEVIEIDSDGSEEKQSRKQQRKSVFDCVEVAGKLKK